MMFIIGVVISLILLWLALKNRIITKQAAVEGIIIGLLSGMFISFFTDANVRAGIYGPIITVTRYFSQQAKYTSQNWTHIQAKMTDKEMVDVRATNIASGAIVTFDNRPLSSLPADLRYAVATGDVVESNLVK